MWDPKKVNNPHLGSGVHVKTIRCLVAVSVSRVVFCYCSLCNVLLCQFQCGFGIVQTFHILLVFAQIQFLFMV